MRILGIDPGTATTGYALVDGRAGGGPSDRLVEHGAIRTGSNTPMPDRLAELHRALSQLIAELRPDAVAVEEIFFARNFSTALSVGQARGVILLCAAQADLPVHEYSPRQIKLALTGHGGADKRQMQDMLRILLDLAEPPRPDDAADAAATALCHIQSARAPYLD